MLEIIIIKYNAENYNYERETSLQLSQMNRMYKNYN